MKRNKINQAPDYANKEIKLLTPDEWRTPQWLFKALDDEFHFQIDLAASVDNHKCEDYYTKEVNALTTQWETTSFANYPYSSPKQWFLHAWTQSVIWNSTIVFLAKVATSENYWCENVKNAHVRFIHSRVKFWDENNTPHYGASFGSAIIIWSPETHNNPKTEYWDYTEKGALKLF